MLKIILLLLFISASAHAAEIITPEGPLTEPVWTEEEKLSPLSKKKIGSTPESARFWIRLLKAEEPHIHRFQDVTVVMVQGQARLHFQKASYSLDPGDIAVVPRGEVHWAENVGPEAALVYAIFTPDLAQKDYEAVPWPFKPSGRESV